jgi:phosphoglycolate phosphatase
MIRLAIFDLDGTLLDTLEDIADACNHALNQCGFPSRSLHEYRRFVGRGIMNLFRSALPEGHKDEETALKIKEAFVPYYNVHKDDKTRPYPGTIELLDALSAKGIRLAVASNKYQEATEELVRKHFGQYDFTCVLGQREGKPIKPDAGIIFEAMDACGDLRPDEVIYCGDSDVDMQTGNNAGVKTIGVTWGFRTKEELAAYNPVLLADKQMQIFAAIAEL